MKKARPAHGRKKVTLCGSTRFKLAFNEWNARLTLDGKLVYSVAMWSHGGRIDPTEEQKVLLDQIHLAKIDESDEVFVLDVGGYIGESTRREINYAISQGKSVQYLSKEYPDWTEDDCVLYWKSPDITSREQALNKLKSLPSFNTSLLAASSLDKQEQSRLYMRLLDTADYVDRIVECKQGKECQLSILMREAASRINILNRFIYEIEVRTSRILSIINQECD